MKISNLFKILKQNPEDVLIVFNNSKFWSRFFILNIIILVVLVILSIFGAFFLEKIMNPVKFSSNSGLIVEIYPESNNNRTIAKKEIVIDYLKSNNNIDSISEVPYTQLRNLLQQWTNVLDEDIKNLPFPILLNVNIKKNSNFTGSDLQLNLNQKVKNVYVESKKNLLNKLTVSLNVSRTLILSIPLTLFLIIFGIVVFVVLGIIYAHKKTIEVLYYLGASYINVSTEITIWLFKRSFKGCIIGVFISFIILEIFLLLFNFNWLFVPSMFTIYSIIAVIIIVPIETALISFLLVRKIINWVI